jgi:hypothetical protein
MHLDQRRGTALSHLTLGAALVLVALAVPATADAAELSVAESIGTGYRAATARISPLFLAWWRREANGIDTSR